MIDPYEVLGVDKNCNGDEVKKAYYNKAKENHPDKGGDSKKFALVKLSYDTLKDSAKRNKFDKDGVMDDVSDSQQEGQAVGELQQLFISLLQKTDPSEISFTDLIGKLRGSVLSLMKEHIRAQDNLEESRKKTEKAIGAIEKKLKRKGKKPNFLLLALKGIVSGMHEEKIRLAKREAVLEEMIKLLQEFTYEYDTKPDIYESPGDKVMRMLGVSYY